MNVSDADRDGLVNYPDLLELLFDLCRKTQSDKEIQKFCSQNSSLGKNIGECVLWWVLLCGSQNFVHARLHNLGLLILTFV